MIQLYRDNYTSDTVIHRKSDKLLPEIQETVATIIQDVRQKGDEAVLAYTEKFDGVRPNPLEIPLTAAQQAYNAIRPDFRMLLETAAENIRYYHQKQRQNGYIIDDKPGILLGQRITPLEKAGIYVPGGTAAYPSTVLMTAIPAKIAGVDEIIMVSPPGKDGYIPLALLAAAHIAGVDRIFAVGGAQAIAALAYGTHTIPKADKIAGPGNAYVACAKKMVYGDVDIDMPAGPSEILIIADSTANPSFIAADILSQAEHDAMASAILITTDSTLAEKTATAVGKMLPSLSRQAIAEKAINDNSGIIITDTLERAVNLSNAAAPEHLELMVKEPFALLPLVKNAGSIFLGDYAPEALGDYLAGPNHTLPTSGAARFSSPLSVDDFMKKSSFTYYSRQAFHNAGRDVAAFARQEGLTAHALAAEIRLDNLGLSF